MPAKTLLGELELPLAQCIDVEDSHGLVHHAVPALDGDFLQRTGRRAARVAVTGVVAGPEARDGLEELRGQLRAAKPVDFVADVATATRVTRVLVEKLDVRELAGKPDRFEYAFLLREYVPPPPRQTEVPPVIPPGPATDTGVLEVEVVVEGEPDFDMGRVTVTAQGGGAGGPASRTLTERAGNLWTESAAPLGEHTVTATVAEPEMTGAGTATVRAGQTTRVRIILVPAQGVARAFSISFRFDNAFVEPCMRAALRRAASFGRAHPSQKLIVVGHTDKTGSDAYNQSLSERRARAVFACVSFQEAPDAAVAEWTALRQARTGDPVKTVQDRWGAREYQQMLQQLGDYPGQIDGKHGPTTDEAVRAFRCRKGLPPGTTVDDAVWDALIRDYLADDPPAVPRAQLLPNCAATKLEWIGCGEQDPVNNTEAAHRPNRRVELLFTTSTTLPARAPEPDTWTLHPPGRTSADWCLGPGDRAKRCAFSKRTPPPEPPRLLIQPAEPGTVNAAGRILREVERADGTVEQVPAAGESFVLITAAGEYRAGEAGSGLPTPAKTDAQGAFSFPGKPRGLYALEIQRGVVARLLDAPAAAALGPTVCKALAVDGAKLDVLILRDPVLREIRLPVIVHLMTALHPATRAVRTCLDESSASPTTHLQRTSRDEAAVRTMLTGANAIWGRARVRFEVRDVVREAFATPGRDACHVTEAERNNVVADAATPNAVNLFFFGSVDVLKEGGVTLRGGLLDGAGTQVRELVAISIADVVLRQVLPPIPPSRHTPSAREAEVILAHELGHWLSLDHETGSDSAPRNRGRLMLPELGEDHRRLLDTEVAQARGSSDAAKECVPLALRVAGATRYGGPHGHRFIAIRDAAAPAVTVDAVLPPHLSASGLVMTGGDPGATPTQRTVGRGTVGRTEVIAKLAVAGGRPQETYAAVQVVNFDVTVDGAKRLGGAGGTTFVAVRNATGRVTVRADVTPAPDVVPFDMVTWSAGDETDDPLRRTLSLAAAGTTTVSVTVAGVTKTITLQVSELALNVTGAQRTGPDQFATAQDDTGDVSVEAVLTPPVPDDVGLVDWTGGQPGPGPRFRLVSKQAIQVTTVTASVGGGTPAAATPSPAAGQPASGASRSATITVVSFELDVPAATRMDGPTGKRFVALPAGTPLTVVANVSSPPNPLPPGFITWSGAVQDPAQPLQATVQRPGKNTVTVTADIGGVRRSITLFIVTFRLDVQGATRVATPAGNDFVTVMDAAAGSAVNVGAVIDPLPNPVPNDLVTWASSDGTATAAGALARLVPRSPKREVTVTATVAGQAQSVRIFVSEFTLKVTGAAEIPPVGSGEFISVAAPGTSAVVAAAVDPAPTPTPPDLVVWSGAPATPDGLLARKVAKDASGPAVRVQATIAGITRNATINVVDFTLAVADATALPASGTAFFALAQPAGAPLLVEARITPAPAVPLPANDVVMTGGAEVAGNPRQRTVPRTAPSVAAGVPVQAVSTLLGVTRTATVTVVSFALTSVQGATQIGARTSTLFAATTGAGDVTVVGTLVPVLNPVPAGLVVWTGGASAAAAPLQATVSRATATNPPATVTATVLGQAFSRQVAVLADPSLPGPFPVAGFEYNELPTFTVPDPDGVPGDLLTIRRRALVRFPGTAAAVDPRQPTYPLVLIMHGNHRRFAGGVAVESHRGFTYLAEHLASHGYIAVSIDAEDMATRDAAGMIRARGDLVLRHIDIMTARNAAGVLAGHIDLAHVGLVGHSRGGEGVVAAEQVRVARGLPQTIRAVVSIAPTNFESFTHSTTPFLVLYGGADDDVSAGTVDVDPFILYDRATAPKAMVYAYVAIHNLFCDNPDWVGPGRLDSTDARALTLDHKNLAQGYCLAMMERHLRAQAAYDLFIAHFARPATVAAAELLPQYRDATRLVVDDYEQAAVLPAVREGTNTLSGGVTATGLAVHTEVDLSVTPTFQDLGFGVRTAWDAVGGVYTSVLGGRDASGFQVLSFRVAQDQPSARNTAGAAQDFFVTLADTGGQRATLQVSATSPVPAPFIRIDALQLSRFMTVRLRLDAFTQATPALNLATLQSIALEFRATPKGEVVIDDLEFSL